MTPVNIILAVAGTQGVLNALDSVRGSLGGIAATALGTTSALTGVKSGLDLGGQLNDLAARTGQTVRDLVVMRRALDNAGVGGENAAQYIGLLQKAISGLNEEGGKTDGVFKRLGLDPAQLKNMGVRDQLDALVQGFSKIENPADRATTAMQLFGRSGAQMLQLLGDSTAMSTAERDAGRLATRLQQDHAAFDELGDRLSVAKVRLQEFWVVAAEKALPSLTRMAAVIESINPAPLAAAAGNIAVIVSALGAAKALTTIDTSLYTSLLTMKSGIVMSLTNAAASVTGVLAKALPVGLAAVVTYEVLAGITNAIVQWQLERDAADNAAANAAARQTQQQRDAVRNTQSLVALDAQRKKTAEDIAALEAKAKTLQTRTVTHRDGEGGFSAENVTTGGLNDTEKQKLIELQALQKFQESDRAKALVAANQQNAADAKKLADAQALSLALRAQAADYQKAADAAKFAVAPEEEKLHLIDQQIGKALEQYFADVQAANLANDEVARAAARVKFEATSLDLAAKRRDVEKEIAEEKKKLDEEAARAAEKAAAAAEKAKQAELELLRMKADVAKSALEDRQLEIQRELLALSSDFSRTDAEKWADRKKHLQEAVDAAQKYLEKMKEARDLATTDEGKKLGDANVRAAGQDLFSAQSQLANVGADPDSFLQQLQMGMKELRAEWGTTAEQIAGSIKGAISTSVSSVTQGLTQWAMRAQNFRQMLGNIRTAIGTEIISSIVQMGVQWVANLALMAARWVATRIGLAVADKAVAAGSAAASIPIAMAQSAIWAAPAALATIASWGGAAAAAPGFIAAAIGATTAMSLFDAGGATGGREGEIRGLVHGAEYVFSAPAVRNLGADTLDAMHQAAKSGDMSAFSQAAAPASGGTASSGGAGGGGVAIYNAFFNDEPSARQWLKTKDGKKNLIRINQQNRSEFGQQS